MQDNKDFYNNTVASKNQLRDDQKTAVVGEGGLKVVFIGNSITRHGILPEIGWHRDCGMAASSIEKDYVHQTVSMLEEKYGNVQYCIAQRSDWERLFDAPDALECFKEAYDFDADIVVIRLGENVRITSPQKLEALKMALVDAMRYLTEGRKAKIVVTDTFWRNGTINSAIEAACAAMGIETVKLGDLGDDDSNKALGLFEHAGVAAHPGDRGMRAIAERVFEGIVKVI